MELVRCHFVHSIIGLHVNRPHCGLNVQFTTMRTSVDKPERPTVSVQFQCEIVDLYDTLTALGDGTQDNSLDCRLNI